MLTIINRYEFFSNEFVNALEIIELETLSTLSGVKEYVVAATTVYRGEDLAVKGAVSNTLQGMVSNAYFSDLYIRNCGSRSREIGGQAISP